MELSKPMDLDEKFERQVVKHYYRFCSLFFNKHEGRARMRDVKMLLEAGLDINTPKFSIYGSKTLSAAEIIFDMFHYYAWKFNEDSFLKDLFTKYKAKVTFKIMQTAVAHRLPILQTLIECGGNIDHAPKGKCPLLEVAVAALGENLQPFETLLMAGADMHALTRDGDQSIEKKLYSLKNKEKHIQIYEQFCGGKSLKAAKGVE